MLQQFGSQKRGKGELRQRAIFSPHEAHERVTLWRAAGGRPERIARVDCGHMFNSFSPLAAITATRFVRRHAVILLASLAFGAFAIFGGMALAAPAGDSPWVASTDSKVRLVSGTVEIQGHPMRFAGVQLRMNPGWKTYWRNPGDSGVPPSFDWAGSKNLKSAEVLFPAPHSFADANGTAIGYEDEVVFPVEITPDKAGEPVELALAFNYGLCKDLCVPNDVKLDVTLPAEQAEGDAVLLEETLARVPKKARLDSLPKVMSVTAKRDGEKPALVIDAAFAPNATNTNLFIDGGETYVAVPKPLGPLADGRERFAATFASLDELNAIEGKTLLLTLVSDQGATETTWTAK
jgi:DsbC/DsbD-like thiol-disulfide interchange protein